MARKLRKTVRSPKVLMLEMLIPWIVMGVSALVLSAAGQPELVIYSVSLLAALGITGLISVYEHKKRGRRRSPG
jgi:hypothetical protein